MADPRSQEDPSFDTDNLYRIELYTDQRTGSIRRMVPVDGQGNDDPSRTVRYIGEATAMTPAGTLPLSFELTGNSLAEAAAGFGEGAEQAMADTVEELKRLQREQQGSIVVPGQGQQGPAGGFGGGMPGGGSFPR
ncbi:MAG: hypothetical protein RQ729_08855 [Wenzhouxiangellaceae bacterium]|nr:hypothetical protein [Wenzhouxiangellaceae bacterium]